MKRKAYTTIATLLAIIAICAVVVPVASARAPKPGGTTQTKAQQCATLKLMNELAYESAQEALANEDWEHYRLMMDAAIGYANAAHNLGCSWTRQAQRIAEVETVSSPTLSPTMLDAR